MTLIGAANSLTQKQYSRGIVGNTLLFKEDLCIPGNCWRIWHRYNIDEDHHDLFKEFHH